MLGLWFLVSCGSTAVVPERKPPAPCSPAVVSKGPGQAALDVHLHPAPTDAGGEVGVSVELTARAATLASFQLPQALVQALDVEVTRRRSTCAANGAPNVERLALLRSFEVMRAPASVVARVSPGQALSMSSPSPIAPSASSSWGAEPSSTWALRLGLAVLGGSAWRECRTSAARLALAGVGFRAALLRWYTPEARR